MTAEIPAWIAILVAVLVSVAAAVTAMGVIWKKVIRPFYRVVKRADEMIPVLVDLTTGLKDTPQAFDILKEIVAQFRTDSGSSLRDVVNRLEVSAVKNRIASEELTVSLEVFGKLAEQDRRQLERLVTLLNVVAAKQSADHVTNVANAAESSENQEMLLAGARRVASDLKDTHERADMIEHSTVPGAAADAAARSRPEE
jgi:hypothetical protein